MLFVKTIVQPSKIDGQGLFALTHISAGTMICDWTVSSALIQDVPHLTIDYVKKYGWLDKGTHKLRVAIDDTRFINHSYKPNTYTGADMCQYALRDIEPGDEITEDYSKFDADFVEYAHTLR